MHEAQSAGPATVSDQRPAESGDQLDPKQPGLMVVAMITALRELGLKVTLKAKPGSHALIRATQPEVPTEVVEAPVYTTPGLSQEVLLGRDPEGDGYAWFWVWSDGFRNSGKAELQKFADGIDVKNAADNIRNVLRVNNFL